MYQDLNIGSTTYVIYFIKVFIRRLIIFVKFRMRGAFTIIVIRVSKFN